MEAYYREIRKLKKFNGFEMHHILRRENDGTDTLAKIRSETANPSRFFFSRRTAQALHPTEDNDGASTSQSDDNIQEPEQDVMIISPEWTIIAGLPFQEPGYAPTKFNRSPERSHSAQSILQQLVINSTSEADQPHNHKITCTKSSCTAGEEGKQLRHPLSHSGVCYHHAASQYLFGKAFR